MAFGDLDTQWRRKSDGDINILQDLEAIKASLRNILLTLPGERRRNLDFGFGIQKYLEDLISDSASVEMKEDIINEISKYENRANILALNVWNYPDENFIVVNLQFSSKAQPTNLASIDVIIRA